MAVACRIHRIGSNSLGFTIPQAVAKSGDFEPGTRVVAKLTAAGPEVELRVSRISQGSVGVIVPKAILKQHGLEKGSEFLVPFREWRVARPVDFVGPPWGGFEDWAVAQFGAPPVRERDWPEFLESFQRMREKYVQMERLVHAMEAWQAKRHAALYAWNVRDEQKGVAK